MADQNVVYAQATVAAEGQVAVIPPAVVFGWLREQANRIVQTQPHDGLEVQTFLFGAVNGFAHAFGVPHIGIVERDVEVTHQHQLLVRLDLATGVLGYIDAENGRFVLNTQCNIAADAGISAPVLSRLLRTYDDAGYVYRRIERVRLDEKDEHGLHLVRTRVLIRLTQQFWADLGLRYVHARVQNAARKKREAQLREIGQRKMAELERHSVDQMRRERSRERWKAKEARLSGFELSSQAPSKPESPKPVSQNALAALEKLHASLARKSQSS